MSAIPQQQFDAVKAALDTVLQDVAYAADPTRLAYDYDNVPDPRPDTYVALGISRRYIEGFRMGGPNGMRGGRLTTGYVSKHINFAREIQRRTRLALEDVVLTTTGGDHVGPFRFETEEPISETDAGFMYGYDSWTFATTA